MMPEEETCFCCLRISQQKRRAEDIWLEAGTTAWVRSSRGVSRCCTDKKVPQVCWLPGSDHSMASNLIKFFYCKYGGLSDSLPCPLMGKGPEEEVVVEIRLLCSEKEHDLDTGHVCACLTCHDVACC